MNLVINQYDNSEKAIKTATSVKDGLLSDVVFAVELGFTNQVNKRTFFHSHMFAFHYCIDVHDGEKNVSFDILQANDQTDTYCFWNYTSNFYKPDEKSKKIQVENAQLTIPKVQEPFDIVENEAFHSVVEKIKGALWNKHESILKEFDRNGINYSKEEMNDFSEKLKNFIDVCYKEIEESELKPFIKEYQANSLSANLSQKDKAGKKFKL